MDYQPSFARHEVKLFAEAVMDQVGDSRTGRRLAANWTDASCEERIADNVGTLPSEWFNTIGKG
jgi:hypothetical protein